MIFNHSNTQEVLVIEFEKERKIETMAFEIENQDYEDAGLRAYDFLQRNNAKFISMFYEWREKV